jgi:hypothetical protein
MGIWTLCCTDFDTVGFDTALAAGFCVEEGMSMLSVSAAAAWMVIPSWTSDDDYYY